MTSTTTVALTLLPAGGSATLLLSDHQTSANALGCAARGDCAIHVFSRCLPKCSLPVPFCRLGRHVLRTLLRTEVGEASNRRAWADDSHLTPELLRLYKRPLHVVDWDKALIEVGRVGGWVGGCRAGGEPCGLRAWGEVCLGVGSLWKWAGVRAEGRALFSSRPSLSQFWRMGC